MGRRDRSNLSEIAVKMAEKNSIRDLDVNLL